MQKVQFALLTTTTLSPHIVNGPKSAGKQTWSRIWASVHKELIAYILQLTISFARITELVIVNLVDILVESDYILLNNILFDFIIMRIRIIPINPFIDQCKPGVVRFL